MIARGELCWFDLGRTDALTSVPAGRRPVVVLQSDWLNGSAITTVIGAAVTSNTDLAAFPGNVFLPAAVSGLRRDSAINVSSIATVDKDTLGHPVGEVPSYLMDEVDAGLRRVLGLRR